MTEKNSIKNYVMKNYIPEKKKVTEIIFRKQNDNKPIKFGEINIELHPDDEIFAEYYEGSSEEGSWMPHYFLEVHRDRLETDEEFEKRVAEEEFVRKESKKRRYESYLKLKKEFEQ